MAAVLVNSLSSYAQFIAVLVVFVLVLALTAFTTKWIANYQKQQNVNCNIDIIETTRLTSNKYLQIIRVGETYMAIAVCKDTVTMLCEIPQEQIKIKLSEKQMPGFQELLNKALKKDSGKHDDQNHHDDHDEQDHQDEHEHQEEM